MPPAALIFTPSPTCFRTSSISSNVAPASEKPVEVFIKSAPDSVTTPHSFIFSCCVRRQVSIITFSTLPCAASFTRRISSSTRSNRPSFTKPRLITISISSAPCDTASPVSKTLTAVV